ncbi:MAG: PAS domain-containing protein [Chloroflexi bacterium]|nr:PAS domain-containing protein [Chloroflexota bacterium]MBI4504512.1 PAS domain-containing protein [Chloroflexota bacterium]
MTAPLAWRIAATHAALTLALLAALWLVGLLPVPTSPGDWATAIGLALLAAAGGAAVLAVAVERRVGLPVGHLTSSIRALVAGAPYRPLPYGDLPEARELGAALDALGQALQQQKAAVARESAVLAAVLHTMDDAILVTDDQGLVQLINPAAERILQVPAGSAIGRTFVSVVRDHELAATLRASLDEPGRADSETRIVAWGVPRRMLRVVVAALPDGEPGRVVLLQDLTELRRLESARRDFVANISHELRTPLASLKALVETLEAGALDDATAAREFLGRMHVEVDGLVQLVQELLELSRIESGRAELRCASQALEPLLAEAVERLSPQADRAGLALAVEVPDGLPPVWADRARVQQVLLNLVHNAIKFTPPGGRVTVRAGCADGEVVISVADTGVGIAAEDLARIFERFYKADKSRASTGTGLGLAIAKHTVLAHGGRIWAESELGDGATFTFTLPAAGGARPEMQAR